MESSLLNKPLPVIALRNLVLFPGLTIPIRIGRAQSIAAIHFLREMKERAKEKEGRETPAYLIGVLQKPQEQKEHIAPEELHKIGVLCQVEVVKGSDSEGYQLVVKALERVRIVDPFESEGSLHATPEPLPEGQTLDESTIKALLESVKTLAKQILEYLPGASPQMTALIDGTNDLDLLLNIIAANLDISIAEKQEILELISIKDRALKLLDLMQRVRDELQVRFEIQHKMTSKLGKNQREAILREHLRTIQEELGDEGDGIRASQQYRKKIEESQMPEEVMKVALEELRRLETLSSQSPELHVIRNYLDLLLAMPWKPDPEPEIDLKKAREVLDADHYGLDKIKKRIIEHLATMKLKGPEGRGIILLFVGPPGVGKTSLGQSIARALGRKFVRVSLGGVRDDAEIRGHRRTYIGAMPGRIIQGIKRAGSQNPVFLLDEVDKLGRGYQGDPAAALLEVLDPEQNATFTDHYLDVPYDLSKVFFIATANSLETIPGPLLDRMEVIELSGYTTNEKLHIAKAHLFPKQLKEHGLKPEQVAMEDEATLHVITHYTREAGVRDLQRKLAAVCRYAATKIVEGVEKLEIKKDQIEEILGPVRYEHDVTEKVTPPGVTTGLAWTPVGGEILFIEAALMPGAGRLVLTGQLGEVMKESAQIALSLIKSRLPQVTASLELEKKDLHVHVPAGAIPKDGPSAGLAILISMASLFTGQPVNPRLAMTGEITLRGVVTPVGGIKEKVIAAERAGVEHVILSRKNERDLRDVPEEVKSKLRFSFVDDVAEALRIALGMNLPTLDHKTGLWGSFPTPPLATPASSGSSTPTTVARGQRV